MTTDFFDLRSPEAHWYSVIAAAPTPESGETANIAVIVGNGRVNGLRYIDGLPRLRGLAAADEINVYQSVLESLSERLRREGIESAILRGTLGPQMSIRDPRPLYRVPNDELMDQLVTRFLSPPTEPPRAINLEALINRSVSRLDQEIAHTKQRGVMVAKNVRPQNLYGGRLERRVPFNVPRLARALRTFSRDVLIDALAIEPDFAPAVVRSAAGRIGQAFYAYDSRLREPIKAFANRDIRVVGILHASISPPSAQTAALRDFIRDMWSHHADIVIDGNTTNIEDALRRENAWVVEGLE